jgi:hypothetical protein
MGGIVIQPMSATAEADPLTSLIFSLPIGFAFLCVPFAPLR